MCNEGEYVGFDRELGLCKCKVEDLEQICNRECRIEQKLTLQYVCTDPVKLRVTFKNGSYVSGTEARSEPCQTSKMELFGENS